MRIGTRWIWCAPAVAAVALGGAFVGHNAVNAEQEAPPGNPALEERAEALEARLAEQEAALHHANEERRQQTQHLEAQLAEQGAELQALREQGSQAQQQLTQQIQQTRTDLEHQLQTNTLRITRRQDQLEHTLAQHQTEQALHAAQSQLEQATQTQQHLEEQLQAKQDQIAQLEQQLAEAEAGAAGP